MKKTVINIGDTLYFCKIAETEEERRTGLMNVDFLPPDEGMLFKFSKNEPVVMWMKNTKIPLDLISIDEDDVVTKIYEGIPLDETLIEFPKDTKWILEVNAGSGIRVGDDFEFDENTDFTKYIMKIIGSNGRTQFLLQGGERICSRISTKLLIKWAKKADSVKDNPEEFEKYCKRLGKRMFRELYDLDHRDAQYVKTPEN